jgi:hypothetical protein
MSRAVYGSSSWHSFRVSLFICWAFFFLLGVFTVGFSFPVMGIFIYLVAVSFTEGFSFPVMGVFIYIMAVFFLFFSVGFLFICWALNMVGKSSSGFLFTYCGRSPS